MRTACIYNPNNKTSTGSKGDFTFNGPKTNADTDNTTATRENRDATARCGTPTITGYSTTITGSSAPTLHSGYSATNTGYSAPTIHSGYSAPNTSHSASTTGYTATSTGHSAPTSQLGYTATNTGHSAPTNHQFRPRQMGRGSDATTTTSLFAGTSKEKEGSESPRQNARGLGGRIRDDNTSGRGTHQARGAKNPLENTAKAVFGRNNSAVAEHAGTHDPFPGAPRVGVTRGVRAQEGYLRLVRGHGGPVLVGPPGRGQRTGSGSEPNLQGASKSIELSRKRSRRKTGDSSSDSERDGTCSDTSRRNHETPRNSTAPGVRVGSADWGCHAPSKSTHRSTRGPSDKHNVHNSPVSEGQDDTQKGTLYPPHPTQGPYVRACPSAAFAGRRDVPSIVTFCSDGYGSDTFPETDPTSPSESKRNPISVVDSQRGAPRDGEMRRKFCAHAPPQPSCYPRASQQVPRVGDLELGRGARNGQSTNDTSALGRRRWRKYRLKGVANPLWPIQMKNVEPLNLDLIIHDMPPDEQVRVRKLWEYFSPERLSKVPTTGPSVIELTDAQVRFLIGCGLFVKMPSNTIIGPKMRIFLVPEYHKERFRLIIHTIDINSDTEMEYTADVDFEFLDVMISGHLSDELYVFQNDAKAYYHQFTLPTNSRRYFSFEVPGHGILALATVATGQRQCVELAQRVSKFLLELAKRFEPRLSRVAAYVDNFKGGAKEIAVAKAGAGALRIIAAHYGVSLNDDTPSISQEFEHRGVKFTYGPDKRLVARLSAKTTAKLHQLHSEFPQMSPWDVLRLEEAFGLMIYASCILAIALAPRYLVFKLMRRRMQQVALGTIVQNAPARVWPCTIATWHQWMKDIVEHEGRHAIPQRAATHTLITDASLEGFGGILFNDSTGRATSFGSTWAAAGVDATNLHINGLEMRALVLTARRLVPRGTTVRILVDNTSVMYAVRKERSQSYELNQGVIALCDWFEVDSINYIKSEENPADALSRGLPLREKLLVKATEKGQRNGKVEGAA